MRLIITFKRSKAKRKEDRKELAMETQSGTLRQVGWALTRWKNKLVAFFQRVFRGRLPPSSSMTYESWVKGRTNYYDYLELNRPDTDAQFDFAKFQANRTDLIDLFKPQSAGPGQPPRDADLILAKIMEAAEELSAPERRVLYHLRMDYTKPTLGFKVLTIALQLAGLAILLSKPAKGFVLIAFRRFGRRGLAMVPVSNVVPPVVLPEPPIT